MIGIDIVDINRISNKKFIKNIFTTNEINYAKSKVNYIESLSGIFAAKEAVLKAFHLKLYYILRKKIEIKHNEGIPVAYINGKISASHISISHDGNYAIGVCINNFEDNYIVDDRFKNLLGERSSHSHKGTYGKIGLLGGSEGMAGSIYMSSLAAMRSGAGLTYILAPQSIAPILQIKANEQIIKSIACDNFYYSEQIANEILAITKDLDVLAIGPGMGRGCNLQILIKKIIENSSLKFVIDADGLNAISKDLSILKSSNEIVLTPHLGEFSRLTKLPLDEINRDRENIAINFANAHNIILVLKSEKTIVTDGNKIYINTIGNPGMATAGSGDVLTGIIASMLKRLEPFEAASLGVYLHSLAGDLAKIDLGEESLIATDIIKHLPYAFKLLRK